MSEPTTPQLVCPRCSAPVEPLQEYCLDCGLRLPHVVPSRFEQASETVAARRPWAGPWLLPALLGLVIAVLGGGAAIAISSRGEETAAVSTATGGSLTVTEPAETLTAPEPTTTAAPTTAPTTTAPAATTSAPPPKPRVPAAITWPAGKRGWTIVLISLPKTNGRAAAAARAKEARDRGLRRVGILDSSRYASLHPGYYVVFMGVYESDADAASSLRQARAVFGNAYQRAIVP